MKRAAAIALCPISLALATCSGDLNIEEALPAVGLLGPATYEAGELTLGISLADPDLDPVDLRVEAEIDGNRSVLASVPARGHGLVGLSTHPGYPGAPHTIVLDVSLLDEQATVTLHLVPDDRASGLGREALSSSFVLSDGLAMSEVPTVLPLAEED